MKINRVNDNFTSPTNLSRAPRRVFKRQDQAISFAELMAHTSFFVRVETYCPLEPPVGIAIAELGIDLEVGCDADPVDRRGGSLEIRSCFLQHEEGRFWVILPLQTLSFPDPRAHAIFELSLFKDLCECFPEVVSPALIRVTEELRQKEAAEIV